MLPFTLGVPSCVSPHWQQIEGDSISIFCLLITGTKRVSRDFTYSCMMFTSAKDPDVRTVINGYVVVAVVFLWHFIGDLRILYPLIKGKAHQVAFSSSPTVTKHR